ncbi:MAG: hypothetical protein WBC21_00465 [Minisyncoccales bacterium]
MGEEERREILNKLNLLAEKHGIENILVVISWAYGENLIVPKNVTALISISFPVFTEKGKEWIKHKE